MISLFAKMFIKDYKDYNNPNVREAYSRLTGIVGIVLNVLLSGVKFFAGSITGSIAITADALNNLSDTAGTFISMAGMKLAGKSPDPDHPFGHGRIEYLSGAAVAVLIVTMGIELGRESISRIAKPGNIETGTLAIVILILSILVKAYMYIYNSKIGKKINSPGLKAVAIDSISDCVATFVVLGSLVINKYFGYNIDGWGGIAVSAFIIYSGIKVIIETVSPLLGKAPEPELVDAICDIVCSYPEITNMHDLIVHSYGPGRLFVSLHAEVPGDGDLFALHDVVDNAEYELEKKLGCKAVIHMDPILMDDSRTNTMKKTLIEEIARISTEISIHDFRVVDGPTHMNVVFDAVIPIEQRVNKAKIKKQLEELVIKLWKSSHPKINIEFPYH
ncbi:MAG: cation transporter [Ruminococcaceae bacterium]|nr:cation transporter [Oscillospiraceae bacterium]